MPAVLSTPAGATVIYLSSTWPWSLHTSSNKMTFWSDLLSALAQLMLLTSFVSQVGAENNFPSSTASTPYSSIASYQSHHSHGNSSEALKHSINQVQQQRMSGSSATMMTTADTIGGDVVQRIFNLTTSLPLLSSSSPASLEGSGNNLTVTDVSASNLVDCNDFTEQKLLNIVICSISDVNSNVINGTSADNSTFNDTALRNISDEYRFYNTSDGSDITGNNTSDDTLDEFESTFYFIQVITTAVVLGIIILATVIGNVFVIAAILLEKNLQSVANNLILSLAVADLLVACLVMPLSAVYEVSREWKLGPEICDLWTSADVLCCTASILHLVAIALDRFWAVTNIDYAHQRTAQRIVIMIVIIWILSGLVSVAPLFGWKDPEWSKRLDMNECLVSQDVGYQIFATASSFYVPLFAILFLYWRIFLVARRRIRRRQQGKTIVQLIPMSKTFVVTYGQQQEQQKKKQMPSTPTPTGVVAQAVGTGSGAMATAIVAVIGRPLPTISEATTTTTTTAFTNVSSTNTSPEKTYHNGLDDRIEMDPPTSDVSCAYPSNISCPPHPNPNTWKKQQQAQEALLNNNPAALLLNKDHQLHPQKLDNKAKPSILKKKTPNDKDNSSKRERKAAKTLAIITGAFVVCWCPFFVIAVWLPICGEKCEVSPVIISFFLWLGYFNSTLNPILYTIFNQDFRNAFKRILCGRRNSVRRNRNRRMGREAR